MGLELDLGDGDAPLPLSDAYFVRELGRPVMWTCHADIPRGGRGRDEVARLAALLKAGPTIVTVGSSDHGQLGPAARVVGAEWSETRELDRVRIDCHVTSTLPSPDPFLLRRRVHVVKNMKQLLDKFGHVAVLTQAVDNEVVNIDFPDGEKACVVQDSCSDWDFFAHALSQCFFLAHDEAWTPLVLTGSVDEDRGTAGRWIVTAGRKKAYQESNSIEGAKVQFVAEDRYERPVFGSVRAAAPTTAHPWGVAPSVVRHLPGRSFSPQRWQAWRVRDLPLFTDRSESLVWKITDRLYPASERAEDVGWSSWLHTLPEDADFALPGPSAPSQLHPWVSLGTVSQTSSTGPWITAKLPGFQSGEDAIHVRLATPYSGTNGKRGLHLVPEAQTQVVLAWAGRFGESVIVLGNARERDVKSEFASPSLWLESKFTGQLADSELKEMGHVTIGSDLSVAVDKKTRFTSSQDMAVRADSTDVTLKGGIFRTGKGF